MSPIRTNGDTVLVITARDSDTGDAVTLALQDLGVRTVRFDLADLSRTVSVSARCDAGQWQGLLTVRSRATRLRDVVDMLSIAATSEVSTRTASTG